MILELILLFREVILLQYERQQVAHSVDFYVKNFFRLAEFAIYRLVLFDDTFILLNDMRKLELKLRLLGFQYVQLILNLFVIFLLHNLLFEEGFLDVFFFK